MVHVAGPSIPPRATSIIGRQPRPLFVNPELQQLALSCSRAFPLPPEDDPELAPEPSIQILKDTSRFRQLEIINPATQNWCGLLDNFGDGAPPSPPEQFPEFCLESNHRSCRHFQSRFHVVRHGISKKAPFPRSVNGAFGVIDL